MKIINKIYITLLIIMFYSHLCYAKEQISPAKDVYKIASKSIVTIKSIVNGNEVQGSGVVYANGYDTKSTKINSWIVTNAHVIKDSKEVTIIYNNKQSSATINYFDIDLDLAILETKDILNPAEAVKVNSFAIGDRVYSIGSPLGLSNSISEGIISGKRTKNELNTGLTNMVTNFFDVIPGFIGVHPFFSAVNCRF